MKSRDHSRRNKEKNHSRGITKASKESEQLSKKWGGKAKSEIGNKLF